MKFTVAIDGPAAAGKGTIARALAEHFGFAYLDTGLLYRAVGQKTLTGAEPVAAAKTLAEVDLAHPGLRSPEVAEAASRVAAIPEVRAALVDFQRRFARQDGGAVLDGRDIGTAICPDAEVKMYVTASDAVRARRRFEELRRRGENVTLDDVARDLGIRDARDAARDIAPMKMARDAILLDTTDMSIDQAIGMAVEIVEAALKQNAVERK